MTAGRGIVHSEMPFDEGYTHGLQLWVNLAKEHKMIEPQYQELKDKDIPRTKENGVAVKLIAGSTLGIMVCFCFAYWSSLYFYYLYSYWLIRHKCQRA